ncbi:MAG: hypothetical protein KA764_15625, partial [Anaerolineales bacterium]|nr:hypothetical protein [Anaerolineales bacterium]
ITGDNITVHHLYNIKRLAYELNPPPAAALLPGSTDDPAQFGSRAPLAPGAIGERGAGIQPVGAAEIQIDEIVRRVLAELQK